MTCIRMGVASSRRAVGRSKYARKMGRGERRLGLVSINSDAFTFTDNARVAVIPRVLCRRGTVALACGLFLTFLGRCVLVLFSGAIRRSFCAPLWRGVCVEGKATGCFDEPFWLESFRQKRAN